MTDGVVFSAEADRLSRRVSEVREKIAVAARPWGHSVRIVAVTKTVEPEKINLLTTCGIRDIGENRAQEFARKKNTINDNLFLHIIGQIQTNKVKYIINDEMRADMVQSVDRKALAHELDRHAGGAGIRLPVLIQANIVPEPQKGGVSEAELPELAAYCASLPNLHLQGLMWIAPLTDDEGILRHYFRKVRILFERLRDNAPGDADITWLSMGMSSDYEMAVSEGANMVRLGSVLFGSRPAVPGG